MTSRERFKLTGQIYFGLSSRPSRNARTFYDLARKHRLPEPLGRAIYAASRAINDSGFHDPLRVMRSAKPSTAARWLAHWERGGSMKSLQRGAEDCAAYRRSESCRHVVAVDLRDHVELHCGKQNCRDHRRWAPGEIPPDEVETGYSRQFGVNPERAGYRVEIAGSLQRSAA